jgi:integrase/recombinase XerC
MPQLELFCPRPRSIPIRLPLPPLPEPRPSPSVTASGVAPARPAIATSLLLPLSSLPPPRPAAEPAAPAPPGGALAPASRRALAAAALEPLTSAEPASDLQRLVEAFAISAVANENTRRAYRANLLRLLALTSARHLRDLTIGDLLAIRAAVAASDLASASQALALFALRAFLRWAESVGQRLPFELRHARAALKPPKIEPLSPPAILSDAEAHRVLSAAREADGQRAMVLVLLGAGLRIEELCKLDCADLVGAGSLDPKAPPVLRISGKGSKQRFVPLLSPIVHGLVSYLASTDRAPGDPGPIFLAHDAASMVRGERRRIGVRSARKRLSTLFRKQGVSSAVCVHGFRHTFSTAVIANGGSLKDLADLLGHSSIVTTARYVSRLGADVGGLLGRIPLALVAG